LRSGGGIDAAVFMDTAGLARFAVRALGASDRNVIKIFVVQGTRQLVIGLALSAVLSAAVLLAISQGFSVGATTLTLIAAAVVVVVSTTVLFSIYFAGRGIVRFEPGAILRS
jgi:hypothetical protein